MKSFEININSNTRAIPVAIISFGLSIYLMTLIPREWPDLVNFGTVAILFFAPILPVTILSRGKIKIELTDETFRAIWIKRFILSREPNIELGWDRIVDYVNQEDRGLDAFRLTLTNNQQLKFYRYTYFPQKDDFEKFLSQFPKFSRNVNRATSTIIEHGKTDFQTKSFKWILIGMTVLASGLFINKMMNPDSGTGWPALGVILSAILFYWVQTRKHN